MAVSAETAIRTLALAAGIAPDALISLAGSPDRLLAAALQAPVQPTAAVRSILAQAFDGLGDRLVRLALVLAADDGVHDGVRDVVGRMPDMPSTSIVQGLQDTVIRPLFAILGVPDAPMRGALITAQLGGLIATRNVMKLEPLASASDDELVAFYGPIVQRLLDPTIPLDLA
jgi:hypothetical protein